MAKDDVASQNPPSPEAVAIGRSIRFLLFEKEVVPDPDDPSKRSPLANTATFIANWIATERPRWVGKQLPSQERSNGPKKKRRNTEVSTKSAISSWLSGRRGPSDELRQAVLDFVDFRLASLDNRDRVKARAEIDFAFDQLHEQIAQDNRLHSLDVQPTFASIVSEAKHWFAILPGFFPTGPNGTLDPQNESTRRGAIQFSLVHTKALVEDTADRCSAICCFVSKPLAEKFWFDMLYMLTMERTDGDARTLTMREAVDRLKYLDDNKIIRTFILDPRYVLCPVVLIDPERSAEYSGGFHIYHVNGAIRTFQIPKPFLAPWQDLFNTVDSETEGGPATRLHFARIAELAEAVVTVPGGWMY